LFESAFLDETTQIIRSGRYILGDKLERFEQEVASYIGTSYCAGVASGTDALEIAFKMLNLSENDEVIIQANAYIACAFGTLQTPASLRIIDCSPDGTFEG
jgi:dTDP-4-amino-4,6-dideoxygalactose transaminase